MSSADFSRSQSISGFLGKLEQPERIRHGGSAFAKPDGKLFLAQAMSLLQRR